MCASSFLWHLILFCGAILSGFEGYSCVCAAGYTGEVCDVNIDDCHDTACKKGYRCEDMVNDYKCVCNHGDCKTLPDWSIVLIACTVLSILLLLLVCSRVWSPSLVGSCYWTEHSLAARQYRGACCLAAKKYAQARKIYKNQWTNDVMMRSVYRNARNTIGSWPGWPWKAMTK